MAVRSPLNAFSFDIWLIEIGQEIKLLEHFFFKLDHPVYLGVHVANDLKKDEIKNKPHLLNDFYGRVVVFKMCLRRNTKKI
jgi:CRISPR/Cas system CMR-associated protein Cmr3 (group 5 of RAMP superfamily)